MNYQSMRCLGPPLISGFVSLDKAGRVQSAVVELSF